MDPLIKRKKRKNMDPLVKPRKRKKTTQKAVRKMLYSILVTCYREFCWYCGSKPPEYDKGYHLQNGLQIDHITPLSSGGSKNDLCNLALACPKWNKAKSDLLIKDFYIYLEGIRSHQPLYDLTVLHPIASLIKHLGY